MLTEYWAHYYADQPGGGAYEVENEDFDEDLAEMMAGEPDPGDLEDISNGEPGN